MKATLKIEDIKKMRRKGFTLREIGEKYAVSRQRIHQILEKEISLTKQGKYCPHCLHPLTKIDR